MNKVFQSFHYRDLIFVQILTKKKTGCADYFNSLLPNLPRRVFDWFCTRLRNLFCFFVLDKQIPPPSVKNEENSTNYYPDECFSPALLENACNLYLALLRTSKSKFSPEESKEICDSQFLQIFSSSSDNSDGFLNALKDIQPKKQENEDQKPENKLIETKKKLFGHLFKYFKHVLDVPGIISKISDITKDHLVCFFHFFET